MISDSKLWNAAACLGLEKIKPAYETFEWQKKRLPEAWDRRFQLEADTKKWLMSGASSPGREVAQLIHKWGFGVDRLPTSCDAAWDEAFREMMLAWHSSNDEVRADRLLAQLLTYKGLGIARVSKWLCFIDQSRFVIFDSRVSRALRCINIDGQRVFPIISGRVPKAGAEGWTAADISGKNLVSNALTVSTYRLYLRLVKMISGNRGLEPAKVEMGLFMMGKGFPPLTEPRLPFGRELHK